jgi:hypothetical protein
MPHVADDESRSRPKKVDDLGCGHDCRHSVLQASGACLSLNKGIAFRFVRSSTRRNMLGVLEIMPPTVVSRRPADGDTHRTERSPVCLRAPPLRSGGAVALSTAHNNIHWQRFGCRFGRLGSALRRASRASPCTWASPFGRASAANTRRLGPNGSSTPP